MAYVTPDKYSPYPRCCDICGILQTVAGMRKLDGQTWVCYRHTGERTKLMLDTLNAHARPPQTWPVADAKPQNPLYPNSLEADDGDLFNFIAQQITARARYERVISGSAPYATDIVLTMAWAARYLYDLIQQGTRKLMIPRAKVILATAADYLITRQRGAGLTPAATRANDAFFGGFLESGATTWVTDTISASGLALLYAYRVLGTASYLTGARSAASYLRNVQAIGSSGTHYTSSDSGGTARLNTGGLASQVADVSGFYSNHAFYPSSLQTLEFWKELQTTDGDQSLGATVAVTGFSTIPAQLLSLSITQLRAFWADGVRDSAGDTFTGLSSATPREFFNAYPAVKPNFSLFAGTGRWEFQDGDASVGTAITGANFSAALGSLYAYEGLSTQVTEVFDWLATFDSNADFETPDNTSPSVLARTTTGEYDPTICIASLLQVRDPDDSYAAIATNASSLYDWGAYGAMARLWAARNLTTFKNGRVKALNIQPRFDDGKPTDGQYWDRIQLRGYSGLSFQTSFAVDASGNASISSSAGTSTPTPASVGLVFWVKGDAGLASTGGVATSWADQSGFGQNIADLVGNPGPGVGLDSLNGIPGVTYPLANAAGKGLYRAAPNGMLDRNGVHFGYGPGETQARTFMAVLRPRYSAAAFGITGGLVCEMGSVPTFQAIFDLEDNFGVGGYYLWSKGWRDPGGGALQGPTTTGGSGGPYDGTPIVAEWSSTGFNNIEVRINNVVVPLTPSVMPPPTNPSTTSFALGCAISSGLNFFGSIFEAFLWDHALDDDERAQQTQYILARYTGVSSVAALMVNDGVRAAQYGRTYREAH